MKKLKLMAFVIGLLLANVAGFAQVPTFDWAKNINEDTDTSLYYYRALDMVTDIYGNVYSVCAIDEFVDIGWFAEWQDNAGVYVVKHDALGNKIWAKEFWSGGTTAAASSLKIKTDSEGYIYITGRFYINITFDSITVGGIGTNADFDNNVFIAKLSPSGQTIWAKGITSWRLYFGAFAQDITIDGVGNVYVGGLFSDTIYFDNNVSLGSKLDNGCDSWDCNKDIFVAKYSPNGTFVWAKKLGLTSSYNPAAVIIESDSLGNYYLVGSFSDSLLNLGNGTSPLISSGGNDIFLAKYDTNDDLIWYKQIGGLGDDFCNNSYILENKLYLSGKITGANTVDGLNFIGGYFVSKFDKEQGGISWIKSAGGGALYADREGSIYVTGNYYGTSTFANNTVDGGYLLVKYDSLGNGIWGRPFLQWSPICVGLPDNIYTVVNTNIATNLDNIALQIRGNYIAKLDIDNPPTSAAKDATSTPWHLYPNPASGGVFVTELAETSEVSVTDVLGKELYSNKLNAGKHEIRLPEVGSGVYFVRVSNAQGVSVKKLVVE